MEPGVPSQSRGRGLTGGLTLLCGLALAFSGSVFAQSLSIDDVSVSETAGSAVFAISLDVPSPGTVTVDWQTIAQSATSDVDFTSIPPTTVTFQPNETSKTVTVTVLDDALYEASETFAVSLSNPSGALIADGQGTGTILDDDPFPAVGFASASGSATEATVALIATVSLSAPAGVDIAVPFTVGGTAVSPDDYTLPSTPVVVPAGSSSTGIVISLVNDALDEADETVILTLQLPPGAPTLGTVFTGTILDNDSPPGLSVGDVIVNENAGPAVVFVALSGPSGLPVSVDLFTQNLTAIAGQDYTGIGTAVVSFQPGETVQSVPVAVLDDTLDEDSETFTVNLNNAVNAAISRATATVTITDDDLPPTVSVNDLTMVEGIGTANFIVILSAPSALTVTVTAQSQDGSALAGLDYSAVAPTVVTFSPGQTIRLAPVTVLEDALIESPETFSLTLTAPSNATIADGTALGTITDNDAFYPSDFSRYAEVTIETGGPAGQFYSVGVAIDTSALISSGVMKSDASDLAAAWDATGAGTWIEIDAHLRTAPNTTLATSNRTEVWFAIHEPAGIVTPHAGRYRFYYGNPFAVPSVRRRDGKQVYRLFDDFSGSTLDTGLWYVHPSYRPAVTVSGGMLHQNGALSPGAIWQGAPIRMVSQSAQYVPSFSVSYAQAYAGECRFRSLNITDDVRPVNTLMHMPPPGFPNDHDEYTTFLHSNGASSIRLVKVSNGVGTGLLANATVIAPNVWYDLKTTARLTVTTPGQERALHALFLNGALLGDSAALPRGGYDATITSGQVGIETDPGSAGDYDWFLIRDFTANEPALVADPYLNLKMKQTASGTEADWSDPGGAVSFDVIRGQLSFIQKGATALDLGPVICLENDSPDSTTGPDHLDAANPPAGGVFFYLVRTRTSLGAGTYGHTTLGLAQVPSGGDCF